MEDPAMNQWLKKKRELELMEPVGRRGSEFETPVLTSPDETLEAATQHKHSACISTKSQLKD